MQTIIKSGNRAVIINNQDGHIWANLYVNARKGDVLDWDITSQRWTGSTMKGAERWAAKQLKD